MHRSIGVFALVILLSGEVVGGEPARWPGANLGHAAPGCARCGGSGGYGGVSLGEENPLYPHIVPWTLEQSSCKTPWGCQEGSYGRKGWHQRKRGEGELIMFPPLPYGRRAMEKPASGAVVDGPARH